LGDPEPFECYKIAIERLNLEGDWFYKRVIFFYAIIGVLVSAQGYLYFQIGSGTVTGSFYSLIFLLCLLGVLASALMAATVANSMYWQSVEMDHISRMEASMFPNPDDTRRFYLAIMEAGRLLQTDSAKAIVRYNIESPWLISGFSKWDVVEVYYYVALIVLALMTVSGLTAAYQWATFGDWFHLL
jgi:hypothetical protein